MIAKGSGGAIVNVSSQASMIALKDHTLYCKFAYQSLICGNGSMTISPTGYKGLV